MTRRELLKASLGAASLLAVPAWARSIPHDPENPIIVGTGEHKYTVIHDWLMGPSGTPFGDTHGLAQDKSGNIYVAHTVGEGAYWTAGVCVYTAGGKYLRRWGSEFAGGSHGLDIREENGTEYLYHCDTRRRLMVKTDLAGRVIWEQGVPTASGLYQDNAYVPTNVAFHPNGNVIVTDGYGSGFVHEYTSKGDYIRSFGKRGNGQGELIQPHGIWIDDRGHDPLIVVADRGNNRLQYFDFDGKHVKFVTDDMKHPCHFDIRDNLLLVPHLSAVVALYDEHNKMVAWLGEGDATQRGKPREEFPVGKFVHPHDAMFLANGDILVAEWVPQGRVTLLKKTR